MRSNGNLFSINEVYKYPIPNFIDSTGMHFTKSITTNSLHYFQRNKMKSTLTPTIVFAVLLTIWVHVTVAEVEVFDQYLQIFADDVRKMSPDGLPFRKRNNVIAKVNETSDEFKQNCVAQWTFILSRMEAMPGLRQLIKATTFDALKNALSTQFADYRRSVPDLDATLSHIENVDPLGFIAYLKRLGSQPLTMKYKIEKYHRIMLGPPYSVIETASTSSTQVECAICCQTRTETDGQWVALSICDHAFCKICIDSWIAQKEGNAFCPTCRAFI